MSERPSSVTLIYDGACPFCTQYARYVKLKDAVGSVRLIDARAGGSEVEAAWSKYDLDNGMLAQIDGQMYYGDDALHVLALLSSRSGFFNKMNYFLFRNRALARVAYPFLRGGRNLALLLKGEKQMKAKRETDNESTSG